MKKENKLFVKNQIILYIVVWESDYYKDKEGTINELLKYFKQNFYINFRIKNYLK